MEVYKLGMLVFDELQDKGLRIAWQYRKYMGEHQHYMDSNIGMSCPFRNLSCTILLVNGNYLS